MRQVGAWWQTHARHMTWAPPASATIGQRERGRKSQLQGYLLLWKLPVNLTVLALTALTQPPLLRHSRCST